MPKLLALLVCEKVITDAQQVPSLIGIFQRINVQSIGAPMPENAVTPMKWAVFTLWDHGPDEFDKEYVQRTEILAPSGDKFIDAALKFKLSDREYTQSKNTAEIFGIPTGSEGSVTVRVWIEEPDPTVTEYKFGVKYQAKENDIDQITPSKAN